MDANNDMKYSPPPDFKEEITDPVIDLSLTDSTEFWLIQWPINQSPDFDGQELTLKLHRDGHLGSFEGSSGKSYDVVSFASQNPDATVFLPSSSGSKAVGKISRRVSLVHFPEPSELQTNNMKNSKPMYHRSSGTSLTKSSLHFASPSQGFGLRNSLSTGGSAATAHRSRERSSVSQVEEPSKPSKRKSFDRSAQDSAATAHGSRERSSVSQVEEPSKPPKGKSFDQSTQDSGQGHGAVTPLGSLDHSNEKKSKKKKEKLGSIF